MKSEPGNSLLIPFNKTKRTYWGSGATPRPPEAHRRRCKKRKEDVGSRAWVSVSLRRPGAMPPDPKSTSREDMGLHQAALRPNRTLSFVCPARAASGGQPRIKEDKRSDQAKQGLSLS